MKPGDETINDFRGPMGRDPLLGTRVNDYEVQSVLGSGAMGIVYRAQHVVIGKPAALKVLKHDYAGDPDRVNQLVREARTVNAIRHPGIVEVFDFGTLPSGQPYILMDLLVGEPLDAWIKREAPAPFKKVAPILDEMLAALHAAHQVGVIHRDLKPGNVFYESHPEARSRVRIIDFGLARQSDRAGGSVHPTTPGSLIGTPAFMAPEQALGAKVYPATDLYAVGGIAYQMLTGRLPHEAPSAVELISQKLKFDPVPARQWAPSLDDDVDSFVMMLLDREPGRRPESADDARHMLRRLTEGRTRSDERVKPVGRAMPVPTVISASAVAATRPLAPVTNKTPAPAGAMQPAPPVQASNPGRKSQAGLQHPGVVPKRQWGEARTVVSGEGDAPAPGGALLQDTAASPTDLERRGPADETLLQPGLKQTLLVEPGALAAPPGVSKATQPTGPLGREGPGGPARVNDTQPVGPVALDLVAGPRQNETLLVPPPGEQSGSSRETTEDNVSIGRSKGPLVVVVLLALALLGALVALLSGKGT
ncbi:MAG: protein kinase [Myxococcaceae bacterium]|nr:protein kinase [Myxococcaceae bacterium]MCA3016351.1 protein kinase [Myxococcaceae bacterium]